MFSRNHQNLRSRFFFVPVLLLALAALQPACAAVALPAGTPIRMRLQQTLASNQSRAGESFSGVVSEAVVVQGKTVIPKGATVHGKVATARPSGRLKTPAALFLRLTSVEVRGQQHAIQTRLVGRSGKSHKKRNIEMIGGGAGLGALIGGIAGGGKGAAIGAAAGAGAGTAGAAATGKKDVVYPVETPLTFRLARAAALP